MNPKLTTFDFSQVDLVDLANSTNNILGTSSGELLIGTSSSQSILGNDGDDIIVGKDGSDTLIGGAGNDGLATGRGDNLLLGNDGDDNLFASNIRSAESGNNVFNGGTGNDILRGNGGNDFLSGAADNDLILGAGGRDNILGGAGIDTINGGAGNDRIFGEDGNDELDGGDGNDLIFGGNGLDTLSGLEGFDTLNGGAEADFFVLIPDTERDTIVDFQKGQDKLVLFPTPRFGSPLTFEQLSITQNNNSTVVRIAETNETLAVLNSVTASSIESSDFINIEELENEAGMTTNMAQVLSQIPTENITAQTEAAEGKFPSDIPETVGAVTSQGVEVINADEARRRFNVDGSDVTVGIISNSFDRDLFTEVTANNDVATGDLPGEGNPNGYIHPVSIVDDSADNSSLSLPDEGRALAQIVTDIAPGANILFNTSGSGAEEFARGIDNLVAAGADIIVDDINNTTEPFFQDGVIAQAASRAVDRGVAYFSAAGNYNRNSYEAQFRPVTDNSLNIPALDRYSFHDFNPDREVDIVQNFTLEPGEGISLSLQWDEPFASAGGQGASSDLDIFALDADNNIVGFGAESNIGTDAVERIVVSNSTEAPAEYKLLIGEQYPALSGRGLRSLRQDTKTGGEVPNLIKYIDFRSGTSEAEYFTNSPTIYGQQNAEDVSAVGASFYQTPTQLETFSSVGIIPILFDEQGNRLPEPTFRQTPDIVAPNDVNTTFFGNFDPEEDGFPNFIGTSAAAPHAAGVAALLLDAVPNATPTEVYGALEQTAIEIDNPFTPEFDTGYDTATGFGLIQADLALESLLR